ncbi:hypothetical protein niasHS_009975 [Heterodera schachtii]|uniref:Uncharacterized protein n=1 Tax=Heterodera schachtii TaxID=97005 RepID=A0ABD2JDA9_HETSC
MDSFSSVVFRLPPMVPMCEVLFTVFHDRGSHFASMFPLMEKCGELNVDPRHGHAVSVLDTIHRSDRSPLIRHIRAPLPRGNGGRGGTARICGILLEPNGLFRHFARILPPMVDLLNEDCDLLVIDDLMWPFGYFMATLKRRFWDSARNGPMPHLIVYGTAAQMLNSAESVRAINSRDVFRPSLFSHRLFAFYENFAEIVLVNWITESYMMPNIVKFGVPNFSWAELFRKLITNSRTSSTVWDGHWHMALTWSLSAPTAEVPLFRFSLPLSLSLSTCRSPAAPFFSPLALLPTGNWHRRAF